MLIDGDPQSNATRLLMADDDIGPSLSDVLIQRGEGSETLPLAEAVHHTAIEHLKVVPSKVNLAAFDLQSAVFIGVLREKLKVVADAFEFVVIDSPPSLSQILISNLVASTHVIVPVTANPLSVQGYDDLRQTFDRVKMLNPTLKILGIVTTQFDSRVSMDTQTHEAFENRFGRLLFETIIHQNSKIKECTGSHKPIQLHDPKSRGADNYSSLTEEILSRLKVPIKKRLPITNGEAQIQHGKYEAQTRT
jgi:chromosome partitioning protein